MLWNVKNERKVVLSTNAKSNILQIFEILVNFALKHTVTCLLSVIVCNISPESKSDLHIIKGRMNLISYLRCFESKLLPFSKIMPLVMLYILFQIGFPAGESAF